MNLLHIYAVNEPVTISHTNLTRRNGETPELPPLAEWLRVDHVDTDQIELFPISSLGDMALSDYIDLAYGRDDPPSTKGKQILDALEGAVLLVPDTAMASVMMTGRELTLIGTAGLAAPDNSASLPKIKATVMPNPAPRQHEVGPPIALYALIGMAIVAALIVFVGWS